MRRHAIALAVVIASGAGCGGGDFGGDDNPVVDGNQGSNDAATGCNVGITFDPSDPVAGPDTIVRAVSHLENIGGVVEYEWHVLRGATEIAFQPAQDDLSQIAFPATSPAAFSVFLRVSVPGSVFCPEAQASVTAVAAGANDVEMRIHVVPPASSQRPPIDKRVIVHGGGPTTLADIVLDPGVMVTGSVQDGLTGIPSYLRFMPQSGKEAFVESFSDGTGAYTAIVSNQRHDVLVVPVTAGVAPQLIKDWMPSQSNLAVVPGSTISGVVRDPANAVIAGAKVQLTIAGVPSTLATTNAAGAFTVRAVLGPAGSPVRFDVTPPEPIGLPRLTASATTFDLAQPVTVRYAAGLTTRDLAGTTIRRAGSPVANAKVSVVGTLALVGTVTAGTTANGSGEVRMSAVADGAGVLPALRAPAAALSAVVEAAPGDLAVSVLDLSAGVPASINAPAMLPVTTVIHSPTTAVIGGVTLDALPIGVLQLAGAGAIRATSNGSGTITTRLASGGHYELRISDPAGRGGQLVVGDVTAPAVAANQTLPVAVRVGATVKTELGVLRGASVQLLCSLCTGVARSRPVTEGVTGIDGKFSLAVPDPGTN